MVQNSSLYRVWRWLDLNQQPKVYDNAIAPSCVSTRPQANVCKAFLTFALPSELHLRMRFLLARYRKTGGQIFVTRNLNRHQKGGSTIMSDRRVPEAGFEPASQLE